jgi:heat shock protein HslJ
VSFTTPVETIPVAAPDRYTLRFEGPGRVALRADCNQGRGTYSVHPDRRIIFGPLALTKMACPAGSLSDRFARDVGRAAIWFVRDGDLYLDLPADSGTLRFRRPE